VIGSLLPSPSVAQASTLPGRGHTKMSDQADAWFPRPSTPPATRRQKDDMHHGLPRQRAYCACRTHTDANIPVAQLLQDARGATSPCSSCKVRVVRQRRTAAHFFPPDDDAWMDMYEHDCYPREIFLAPGRSSCLCGGRSSVPQCSSKTHSASACTTSPRASRCTTAF